MKKGIVMEIHRKYAVLLTKDGSFEKGIILTEYAGQGDEVVFQPVTERTGWKNYWVRTPLAVRLSAIVLLALFIFGFSLFYGLHNTTTDAYVAIDINPSIELELDDNFIVTEINALNESARQLAEEVNAAQNQSVYDVLTDIVQESESRGLVAEKTMVVGVSCTNQNGNPERLLSKIDPYIDSLSDWNTATIAIPEEVRELAASKDKSMNEVMAAKMANRRADTIQMHADVTDADNRAIIDFFYGEEASDTDAEHSIEQKIPIKTDESERTDDPSVEKEEGQQDAS